jgi:hypothetical protein
MRLQEKEYVSSLQYRRKYDRAKTPFDRLKEKNILNENPRQQLETQREQINPMNLRNQIDEMISHLLSLPALNHSETVNVFETLIEEAHASVTLSFEPATPFRLHYLLN